MAAPISANPDNRMNVKKDESDFSIRFRKISSPIEPRESRLSFPTTEIGSAGQFRKTKEQREEGLKTGERTLSELQDD